MALAVSGLSACDDSSKSEPSSADSTPAEASSAAPSASTAAVEERKGLLEPGDEAPGVQAVAHTGQRVSLSEFEGRPVIVYFYPKDDTPGCTAEAKGIRDVWLDVVETEAVVLGVSADDNVSHRAFASKHELPFLLLPDTNHEIARAFGVPVKGGMAQRVTFVIDRDGEIAKVFPDVEPEGHAKEILKAIADLKG